MKIVFKNKAGNCSYIVTGIHYEKYKGSLTAYVSGGYGDNDGNIPRRMPTKLFKDKKNGRPCINLYGKMYAVNIEDDKWFEPEILDKAELK